MGFWGVLWVLWNWGCDVGIGYFMVFLSVLWLRWLWRWWEFWGFGFRWKDWRFFFLGGGYVFFCVRSRRVELWLLMWCWWIGWWLFFLWLWCWFLWLCYWSWFFVLVGFWKGVIILLGSLRVRFMVKGIWRGGLLWGLMLRIFVLVRIFV